MGTVTITDLYLFCGNINADSRIVVFEDYDSYLFDMCPIYDGDYDKLAPNLAFSQIQRFYVKGTTLFVEVEVREDAE